MCSDLKKIALFIVNINKDTIYISISQKQDSCEVIPDGLIYIIYSQV